MKVMGTDGKEYTMEPEADLADADLRGADLSGADSGGVDLEYDNLSEANLTDTNLSEAELSGIIWSDETVFPEGFETPDELQG